MSDFIDQNRIRQFFFILLILLMGVVLFLELYTFLPALLGAITLYILLHKWMFFLTEKDKWPKGLVAFLLMLVSFLVILLPVAALVNMLSSKVTFVIQHSSEFVEALKKVAHQTEDRFNTEIVSDENLNKMNAFIAAGVPKILGATFNTVRSE